jgi:hypothetical protein
LGQFDFIINPILDNSWTGFNNLDFAPSARLALKPTSYIVGSEDRTIQPELERFLAKRMNAKVTELASSHVPMLSQPRRVYEVIRDAAGNIQRRAA